MMLNDDERDTVEVVMRCRNGKCTGVQVESLPADAPAREALAAVQCIRCKARGSMHITKMSKLDAA